MAILLLAGAGSLNCSSPTAPESETVEISYGYMSFSLDSDGGDVLEYQVLVNGAVTTTVQEPLGTRGTEVGLNDIVLPRGSYSLGFRITRQSRSPQVVTLSFTDIYAFNTKTLTARHLTIPNKTAVLKTGDSIEAVITLDF